MPSTNIVEPEMQIPKQVKILAKDYSVNIVPDQAIAMNQGAIWEAKSQIQIRDDLDDDTRIYVLWHETIHAINNQLGIGLSEAIVMQIGTGIAQVLKDNFNIEPKPENL